MRSPVSGSPRHTRRSSRSILQEDWSPFRRTSARRWLACSSAALLLGAACRMVAPVPLPPVAAARARLLRIEDTRRDEPMFVDSLLASSVAALRADAALT